MPRAARRLALTLVLTLVLLAGCSQTPSSPVPDSTMVEVLVDLYLAGARTDVADHLPAASRDSVLARHGLDSTANRSALRYFAAHPAAYGALYERVVDRLAIERAESSSQPPPLPDTLKLMAR